jgi:ATP-dependent Lhr-like helicase
MLELERQGVVMRIPYRGTTGWCDRRLLARIQRHTLDRLRREIEPVPTATYLRFLAAWQHLAPDFRGEGVHGLREAIQRLAGFEAPAKAWERHLLARA